MNGAKGTVEEAIRTIHHSIGVWEMHSEGGAESPAIVDAKEALDALAAALRSQPQEPGWLYDLAGRVRTQDNRATANPIFAVQQGVRDWGFEDEMGADGGIWHNIDDDYREATPEESARLEALVRDYEGIPHEWHKAYYRDRWEFVSAFFTEKGAQDYIDINGHNLTDPRIYAYGGWRNAEWAKMREWLNGLVSAPEPTGKREP